jgi:phage recombination protein Bet
MTIIPAAMDFHPNQWDNKKDLLKSTICKGATDGELELFIHVCKHTGLDPFLKQIHPVKRWSSTEKREVMSIQTSIDGFRLIAERSGKYCPGKETEIKYDEHKKLYSATAYVKKQTTDGTWHEVGATAYYDEYVQKTKEGAPTQFWARMPRVMLSKCAESLVLRKTFPAELSGLNTKEEMSQAGTEEPEALLQTDDRTKKNLERKGDAIHASKPVEPPKSEITEAEWGRLDLVILELHELNGEEHIGKICQHLQVASLHDIKPISYRAVIGSLEKEVERLTPGAVNERIGVA